MTSVSCVHSTSPDTSMHDLRPISEEVGPQRSAVLHEIEGLAFKRTNAKRHVKTGASYTDLSDQSSNNVGLDLSSHPTWLGNHNSERGEMADDIENGLSSIAPSPSPPSMQRRSSGSLMLSSSSCHVNDGCDHIDMVTSSKTIASLKRSVASLKGLRRRSTRDTLEETSAGETTSNTFSDDTMSSYGFLAKKKKENVDKLRGLQAGTKWWHAVYIIGLGSMIACLVTLWAPYPYGARMPSSMVSQFTWSSGCQGLESCICPREVICADDLLSMIFLTIARCSAFFDYPLYVFLFLDKAKNINNFLQKTVLRLWIDFSDVHKVHRLFGIIVAFESTSHGFFHVLRWARRKDDIQLLWTSQTGITGLVCLLICPLIVLPMTIPYLKRKISFESRKGLHYLSILWGLLLMFHAPQRIFSMIGVPLLIYFTDKVLGILYRTHMIDDVYFERLGDRSCVMSFANPRGFDNLSSAYVYVLLPWLSKYQWHAFSVYPASNKPTHSQLCISKAGGWTENLIEEVSSPFYRPAFVMGPFLSPFSSPAMDSDNVIAVASGIGITPSLSVIKKYANTRRVNLVWICREAGLIEWFLRNTELSCNGYILIYYTGRRSLVIDKDLPSNILIYEGRPNLERTIDGIIVSIASGDGLPESLNEDLDKVSTFKASPKIRAKLLLEKALSIYSIETLFDYARECTNKFNVALGVDEHADSVDYRGIRKLMQQLLNGTYKGIEDNIAESYPLFESGEKGLMSLDSFRNFIEKLLSNDEEDGDVEEASASSAVSCLRHRMSFEGKGATVGNLGIQYATEPLKPESRTSYYLSGDGKYSAKNWSLLYCGGSNPVLQQLKAYKHKHGITLSVEKFDW